MTPSAGRWTPTSSVAMGGVAAGETWSGPEGNIRKILLIDIFLLSTHLGHSVYLNTEHYFVSFGHFSAKSGQKVIS